MATCAQAQQIVVVVQTQEHKPALVVARHCTVLQHQRQPNQYSLQRVGARVLQGTMVQAVQVARMFVVLPTQVQFSVMVHAARQLLLMRSVQVLVETVFVMHTRLLGAAHQIVQAQELRLQAGDGVITLDGYQ